MPTSNDTIVCPETINSCYFLLGSMTYAAATTACGALGGYPVSWNFPFEQVRGTCFDFMRLRPLVAVRQSRWQALPISCLPMNV